MGRAMLCKSLIQFSVDGRGCVSSLLFDLKPNYGGGNEYNGCHTHYPQPCSRPLPTHTSTGDSWILSGKSGSVSCGGHCSFLLSPGVHQVLFVPSKSLLPQPVLQKFCNQTPLASKVKFPGGSQSLCQIPKLGNLLWVLELS